MLGGCCTRPKGSTRMGHGTSPKGRVSTHSCRLPLCHPVCPTVHTYQHVQTHSVDAITGHPPLCSFRPFFSPAFAALSRDSLSRFVRVYACMCVRVRAYVSSFTLAFAFIPCPLLLHALFFFLVSLSFPPSYSIFFSLSSPLFILGFRYFSF